MAGISFSRVVLVLVPLTFFFQLSLIKQYYQRDGRQYDNVCAKERSAPMEAPYSEFCETTPLGEKQTWNPRKKIISYSLFSSSKSEEQAPLAEWFVQGVAMNAKLAKLYYPDWIVRVYTVGLPESDISRFLVSFDNLEVVRCHKTNTSILSRAAMWRFLAIDDPTVGAVIVRDLDSRFSPRELMAVNEWLGSDKKFHTMRDHDYHGIEVMGGMFGMKRGLFNSANTSMTILIQQAIQAYPTRMVPGPSLDDQNFLGMYVWPKVKDTAMDHDNDGGRRCRSFGSKVCRGFPLGPPSVEEGHFVGAPFKGDAWNTSYSCTIDCKQTSNPI